MPDPSRRAAPCLLAAILAAVPLAAPLPARAAAPAPRAAPPSAAPPPAIPAMPATPPPETYRPLDALADVMAHVQNSYVDEVSQRELVQAAIEGMVSRLDPHSAYLRPEVFRAVREETSGELDGLGVELAIRGDALVVVAPVADSPAERAGLRPGDRLLSIDGAAARPLGVAEAGRRLRGAVGTKVVLEIMRDGFAAPQKLTLVRDRIRLQSVDWRVLDGPGRHAYVRIKAFQDRTDRSVRKALDEARAAVRGELRGLVLDLRNDPGGLLDQAVKVSDLWLASGIIVSTEGRGGRPVETERAHEKGTEPAYPVVVLINRGTASASEIVAGALQDHQRAVILGTQSFGKGSVQSIIELPDGAGLKLTVARYYTPKHRSIQERGITPDLVVPEAPLAAGAPASAEDAQLAAALAELRKAAGTAPGPRPGGAGTPP